MLFVGVSLWHSYNPCTTWRYQHNPNNRAILSRIQAAPEHFWGTILLPDSEILHCMLLYCIYLYRNWPVLYLFIRVIIWWGTYCENLSQASFMWDSFTAGIAISIMQNGDKFSGENDFAVMKYMNLTVVTSNKPYGINDGSNPLFNGRAVPKFNLTKYGVHSGHVQTGVGDPFCLINGSNWGRCEVVLKPTYLI